VSQTILPLAWGRRQSCLSLRFRGSRCEQRLKRGERGERCVTCLLRTAPGGLASPSSRYRLCAPRD